MNGAIATNQKENIMNKNLVQTKLQLDTLFCNHMNEAIGMVAAVEETYPNSLAAFFLDEETGLTYCRLNSGTVLTVMYEINPELVGGTIQVLISLGHPEYGHHALKLLMDVPMLELYKDYINQYINGAITNEHNRVLTLSVQSGNTNKH